MFVRRHVTDLPLIVADKHRGVTFHYGRRQSLEVTPEVTQGHVVRVTWERENMIEHTRLHNSACLRLQFAAVYRRVNVLQVFHMS